MEDLERLFSTRMKPIEEKIQRLEESEKVKELEIVTLKHAVQNLNRIIENLKIQQASAKPLAGAKPFHNKTNSTAVPPLKENKVPKENAEEEKDKGGVKKFVRPQTATPFGKDKDKDAKDTSKPDPKAVKPSPKDAKDKDAKDKKGVVADKDKAKGAKKGTDKADKNSKTVKTEGSEKSEEKVPELGGKSDENENLLKDVINEVKIEEKAEDKVEGEKPAEGTKVEVEEEEVM